ncbi:MAG: zinc ABC transporter substrate-binding protein [Alphaproteobacteria bacterium]|nr:MAG: zinc ABC transporter substrate-binding protein [Alphaproteobacteria bacterium]
MFKSNKIKIFFKYLILSIIPINFITGVNAEIKVVTTIQPLHSLISNVMGNKGKLDLILEGTASPHSFTLKPSHAKMLENADVIFWIDKDLESFLEKPLKSIPKKAKVVHLMDISGLEIHKFREKNIYAGHDDHDKHDHKEDKHDDHGKHSHKEDKHDDHDKHGHAHGEFDVHIWLDPNNAKVIVKEVANQLATLDSKNSDFYKENSKKTINKLDNLINKINKSINKKASFVTFHDAYQYFEKRFGVEALGALTINTDIQPGAKQIEEIQHLVEDKNIKCIFSEPQFNPKLINMIAKSSGAKTGVLDPHGSSYKPGNDLYFNLINDLYENLNKC